MITLAFLQNAWFKPGTHEHLVELYHTNQVFHRRVLARSATGRSLKKMFGPLYEEIIWDNASLEHGSVREHVSPPDPHHIARVVAELRPDVVLLFGRQAEIGWDRMAELTNLYSFPDYHVQVLRAPHPMARGSADEHLKKIVLRVKLLYAKQE